MKPSPELDKLVDGYLDGHLTSDELAALEDLLMSSDEARTAFWQRVHLHAGLRRLGRQAWGAKFAQSGAGSSTSPATVRSRLRASLSRHRAIWISCGINALLLFLLLFIRIFPNGIPGFQTESNGLFSWQGHYEPNSKVNGQKSTNEATVAVIRRVSDAKWPAGVAHRPGDSLASGKFVLESGRVEIELLSGVQMLIQGPAEMNLHSAMKTELALGTLRARVPKSAHGFCVALHGANVIDLGTEFGIDARKNGPAELHVFDGKVRVERLNGEVLPELKQKQAIEVAYNGQWREIPFREFPPIDDLAKAERESAKKRFAAWQAASARLANDPSVLVYYAFEPDPTNEKRLTNRAMRAQPESDGAIVSAEWEQGRWPGKYALEYRRPTDRVALELPGRYRTLTYSVWARFDAHPKRKYWGLFYSEPSNSGEAHWQLDENGGIVFGIRRGPAGYSSAISGSILTPATFGTWKHVVTTVDLDAGTVVHYTDGSLVGRFPASGLPSVFFGHSALGNFPNQAAEAYLGSEQDRTFYGRIDEFVLFNRALSPGEVQQLYEEGKP